MPTVETLRSWTHRRLRLGDPATSAGEALRSVVAVYSAHPTAPLALAARTADMTADQFRQSEVERRALRVPGMRGSLFLTPRENAAMVFAPFRQTQSQLARRLSRIEVGEVEYGAMAARVVAAAQVPRLPRELREAAGIGGFQLGQLLRSLRGQGRMPAVAEGSLRAASLRYVATDSWAPSALDAESTGAAARLAGAYLSAYGPARVADFAWWTGLSATASANALATHDTVDLGDGLLLAAGDLAAFEQTRAVRGSVDLLPKWDAYTMGYAPDGRARLVHPDNQARIYVRKGVVAPGQPNIGLPGDGYPVVLVDGQAVGTWSASVKRTGVELFDSVGATARRRIDERLGAVVRLLVG
jgi:hypothetical protein